MGNYVLSGEGYWYDVENPSKGFYGLPPEIEKEREEEWKLSLILEDKKNKIRVVKAMKIIREHGSRDIGYKINLLKRLGHKHINVKGNTIKLEDAFENYPQNIERMYSRTIQELREIVKNPNRKSKLVDRLNSIQ